MEMVEAWRSDLGALSRAQVSAPVELFMKRHIATALIAGMGLAAPTSQIVPTSQPTEAPFFAGNQDNNTICRLSQFGHLKSAGRFRRNEIARIFVDEGIVFAEWSGQINAPQPRRIETEELDAEWMAHCRDGRWLLSRRELVPRDGKVWSVQVYGDEADAAGVQIVATAVDANGDGAGDSFTVKYEQSNQSTRLGVRGNYSGRVLGSWTATAATLADLRRRFPMVVANYLEPALGRMVS
jgi:hypothetical protein